MNTQVELLSNIHHFYRCLHEWHDRYSNAFELRTLGTIESLPLFLLINKTQTGATSKLVASGFHGEEQCPPWAVLEFLHEHADAAIRSNMSFLPLVNPTGFEKASRYNVYGENPNSGLLPTIHGGYEPSTEGLLLLQEIQLLCSLGQHSFVSLHEDITSAHSFLYTLEMQQKPSTFSTDILSVLDTHFPLLPDCVIDEAVFKDGLAFNHFDGTFEHLMFTNGVPHCACTETPGTYPPPERIKCNVELLISLARMGN